MAKQWICIDKFKILRPFYVIIWVYKDKLTSGGGVGCTPPPPPPPSPHLLLLPWGRHMLCTLVLVKTLGKARDRMLDPWSWGFSSYHLGHTGYCEIAMNLVALLIHGQKICMQTVTMALASFDWNAIYTKTCVLMCRRWFCDITPAGQSPQDEW